MQNINKIYVIIKFIDILYCNLLKIIFIYILCKSINILKLMGKKLSKLNYFYKVLSLNKNLELPKILFIKFNL